MIFSPITLSNNVRIDSEMSVSNIVHLYNSELEINVSKYFGVDKKIKVCECLDTGYRFYFPLNTCADEDFYEKIKTTLPLKYGSPYYADDKWEYDECLKYIQSKDKVYEVGAGNGAFLKKLINIGITDISGCELSESSISQARQEGIILDSHTIEEKAKKHKLEYDVVCSFQVLEHVSDVKSFIESCLHILKPKGLLIIAVPYCRPYLFKNDKFHTLNLPPHHMGLWNEMVFGKLSKFFKIKLRSIIIQKLPKNGYDFERYYEVNKEFLYPAHLPLKMMFDRVYRHFLKKFHHKCPGKNIIAIYEKQ